MKTCTKCGQTKPETDFGHQRGYRSELNSRCKACIATYNRERNRAKVMPQTDITHKQCRTCQETKPVNEFHRSTYYADGYKSQCRPCRGAYERASNRKTARARSERYKASGKQRDKRLRLTFGITLAEYNRMFAEQGGVCAICGRNPSERKVLGVDHDHQTGKIRALLCSTCNTAMGHFKDDVRLMALAIDYLNKHAATVPAPFTFVA